MQPTVSNHQERPLSGERRTHSIAFFGSSLVSAYWNGAATYFRGMIKELHRRGHRITFYEPDAFERQDHRDMDEVPYARSDVYPVEDDNSELERRLEEASLADVVVKASGVGVRDEYLESRVLKLRRGQTRIFWDVDAPATLARMEENPDDPFHQCLPCYDCVFTYGGGAPVVERYEAMGARKCVPIYNALDPETHFAVEPEERFRSSLAFAGNRLPDREERVLEFFFGAARNAPDDSFLLAGNGWQENAPVLPNVKKIGHLYTKDHNAFNRTAKAVLNVCRESMAKNGYSPPTRFFEAVGAGGCLITDAWEGIEEFLNPGEECLVARDGNEVAEFVKSLTWDESVRMGERARLKLLEKHTYAHRALEAERMLDFLVDRSI
ncbi:glycosyltransferase [Pelagicoccus sp. SDUM812002]|uniref:CgeB family protein n=1 Tax=Pelagicoccus sp. SDUM812002 TaxID=3041266 RepID=UPI00280CACA7|nr:glycosyltransferase [Pelagicoccus sp. SDUM812002]MDQ8184111.1 glycosyltransferase [Pelagicoccus sp. SDUM812002]